MQDTWERIEKWLKANAPDLFDSLLGGADEEEIGQTETFLGVALPDDVKASYRIHNGQPLDGPWLMVWGQFLSLEDMRGHWSLWKHFLDKGSFDDSRSEPVGPAKANWWNPRWIPITYDQTGNHLCLDLDPAPGGRVGQIITMWHDDSTRGVLAESFSDWLTDFANALEAGQYSYTEDDGMIEN